MTRSIEEKTAKQTGIQGVKKLATGVAGFDEMLKGGVPENRITLVSGTAGAGKTVLLNDFVYRGVTVFDQPGVLVTIGESEEDIVCEVGGFGWDYPGLVSDGKLLILDLSDDVNADFDFSGGAYDLAPLTARIRHAVEKIGARRLAIDGLDHLFTRFDDRNAIRRALFELSRDLKRLGVTGMISAESVEKSPLLTRYGMAEFVTDAAVHLYPVEGEQSMLRRMVVKKYRGAAFQSGGVTYEISEQGFRVFPKISLDVSVQGTDFDQHRATGVAGLDDAMEGGIPEGHIVLVSGNTGTGKSLLGLHFLVSGLQEGENGVLVALEEPAEQVRKTARRFGWELDAFEREERLSIVGANLIDIVPDRLLYDIIHAVERTGAKRVVLDSISTIQSEAMSAEDVRQFLIQLAGFAKTLGVTCMMTYLAQENFRAGRGQLFGALSTSDMRLSSVVDGIILMRYVERREQVEKIVNIIKMRGTAHSTRIFSYEIGKEGLKLGGTFRAVPED